MRIHTATTIDSETLLTISDSYYEYDGPLALADRSQQAAGKNAETQTNATTNKYGTNATDIGNPLTTTLTNEVNNPQGYTPTQQNAQLVAGEQGAGGALGSTVGEAGLNATRTRNTGSSAGVMDQAMRRNAQTLSQNALGVQNKSADLAQKNRQSGIAGLEDLYGTDVGAQLKSMGILPEDINSELKAGQQGWLQNTEGVLNTIGGLGLGAAHAAGFG